MTMGYKSLCPKGPAAARSNAGAVFTAATTVHPVSNKVKMVLPAGLHDARRERTNDKGKSRCSRKGRKVFYRRITLKALTDIEKPFAT